MMMILSVMTSLSLSALESAAEPSFRNKNGSARRSGPRHVSLDTSFQRPLKPDV